MLHVFLADLLRLRVVFRIKLAAGQRESALVKLRDSLLRVVVILNGGQSEQRSEGSVIVDSPSASDRGMLVRDLINQLGFLLEIVNALQLRLESLGGGVFNAALIHASSSVIANILFHV